MKLLTVKIERHLLHMAETETRGKRVIVSGVRAFPLPEREETEGGDGGLADDPEALARFIADMLKRSRLAPAPIALLFHSEIAPYHEYYHRKLSASDRFGRARAEAEAFLAASLGNHIVENELYGAGDDSDKLTSAVFAISDGFLRALIKSLRFAGIKVRFASSALSVLSDMTRKLLNALLKNDVRVGANLICLDVSEDCVRFLFFAQTRLIHRRESAISEGISDEELLSFIEEETREIVSRIESGEGGANAKPDCILLLGTRVVAPDFADRVAGRMNTPCRSLDAYADELSGAVALGGELADRPGLYVRAISSAGAALGRLRKKNLLYGGFRKRRERGVARAAAVFLSLAAVAAMSAMPLANRYIEEENAKSVAIITRPIYAEAREKLAAQRQLNALLQSHMAEEAYMQNKNLKYGDLLLKIGDELLARSRVERMTHENSGAGVELTFTTSDPDFFLEAKEKMNGGGNLTVEDPVVMNKTDDGLWRCVVTISWEVPAGEVSE
ncbi:MAG: hypothetical protein LBP30_05960 [Clostridiales Family XIII bacterium]|jgi:hypothetical protein|nr:hypothetical protein [Clostridiales Family XIII bacterium]